MINKKKAYKQIFTQNYFFKFEMFAGNETKMEYI